MDNLIVVDEHVSLVGPKQPMVGPIASGAKVVARIAPGCWGPMLTPEIVGGHEVSRPVSVAGAEPGDALVVHIKRIEILSRATMSGTDTPVAGRYDGDPGIGAKCPKCGRQNPETRLAGTGQEAIRCSACGAAAAPFECPNGYTMVFDDDRNLGITVTKELAREIAKRAHQYAALPRSAKQNPALVMAASDLVGVRARMRPFIGNIGTSPPFTIPAAKNSADLALRMVGANHPYRLDEEDAYRSTDAHLDSDQVRTGATLIVPVKIPGAGFYMGDVHATQGDGEIASHTIDVSAEVTVEVSLLKGIGLDFPILLPAAEDLPFVSRPFSAEETSALHKLGAHLDVNLEPDVLPIQVIGTGLGLNNAVDNALSRMSKLTGMSLDEVKNRCTITGGAEIARMSGVVQLSMLVPSDILDKRGIGAVVRRKYQTT